MATVITSSSASLVNTTTIGFQGRAAAAGLANGGYVLAWDGNNPASGSNDIYAERHDADSDPVGGQIVVNRSATAGFQYEPAVAGLAAGGYVVSWTSPGEGGYDIFAQRYQAGGSPAGGIIPISIASTNDAGSSLAGLSGGGFVATWYGYDSDAGTYDIYAQRYASNGTPVSGAVLPSHDPAANRYDPFSAGLTGGGFVITWSQNNPTGDGSNEIVAQRYNSSGAAVGGATIVAGAVPGGQFTPVAAGLADGGYVVAWGRYDTESPGSNVFLQRYAANGRPLGGEVLVNTTTVGDQANPTIGALADGGYVVAWSGYDPVAGLADVFAQRYGADQRPIGGETQISTNLPDSEFSPRPAIASLADGGYVVSWESYNPVTASVDVYQKTVSKPMTLDAMTPQDELVQGTSGDDLIRVQPGGLNPGDQVFGLGGFDTLALTSAGTLDLTGALVVGIEALRGTSGDDVIVALATGADGISIDGRSGEDTLVGDANGDMQHDGNADTLIGGADDDRLFGDVRGSLFAIPGEITRGGNDRLDGDGGADQAFGDAGGDLYAASADDTFLYGGNDTVNGGTGDDILVGDAGGRIYAERYTTIIGGNDSIDGGTGNDLIVGDARGTIFSQDSSHVEGGNDTLLGGDGRDTLAGDTGAGLESDADGSVRGGADLLNGGNGNDVLYGDALGRFFADSSDGFAKGGSDTLLGGDGNDTLYGDSGAGYFSDEAVIHSGHDSLDGGSGNDLLVGDAGGDLEAIHSGLIRRGNDTLLGGEGNDTLVGDSAGDMKAGPTDDMLDGNDYLSGGSGADYIYGDARGSIDVDFRAWAGGNDTLLGGSGDDFLFGDADGAATVGGNDVLQGGEGKDKLWGGKGADTLTGGSDADQFIFALGDGGATASQADVITDFKHGTDKIGLSGGLTFADLTFSTSGGDTTIHVASTGEILAVAEHVKALVASDFFIF